MLRPAHLVQIMVGGVNVKDGSLPELLDTGSKEVLTLRVFGSCGACCLWHTQRSNACQELPIATLQAAADLCWHIACAAQWAEQLLRHLHTGVTREATLLLSMSGTWRIAKTKRDD